MSFHYELSNMTDEPMHETVYLTITVEAPYAEALSILDGARMVVGEIEQEKQELIQQHMRKAFGL